MLVRQKWYSQFLLFDEFVVTFDAVFGDADNLDANFLKLDCSAEKACASLVQPLVLSRG